MNCPVSRAWLFTGHCPSSIVSGYHNLKESDLLIAVDSGLAMMEDLGLSPHLIIGDLDSANELAIGRDYPGVPVLRYPTAKNETDTELAVLWCLQQGIGEIVICNDLQGRFDHALALVQNLLLARDKGVYCRIESANQVVLLLDRETALPYPAGSMLSLIALSEKAEFEDSTGLDYAMSGVMLYSHLSRGISNRINNLPAIVRLRGGKVLAVLTIL